MIKKNEIRKVMKITTYDREEYKLSYIECRDVVNDETRNRVIAMPFVIRTKGCRNDIKAGDYIFIGNIYGVDLKPFWFKTGANSEMFATTITLYSDDVVKLTSEQVKAHIENEKIKNVKTKKGEDGETETAKKVKKKVVPPEFIPFN